MTPEVANKLLERLNSAEMKIALDTYKANAQAVVNDRDADEPLRKAAFASVAGINALLHLNETTAETLQYLTEYHEYAQRHTETHCRLGAAGLDNAATARLWSTGPSAMHMSIASSS